MIENSAVDCDLSYFILNQLVNLKPTKPVKNRSDTGVKMSSRYGSG